MKKHRLFSADRKREKKRQAERRARSRAKTNRSKSTRTAKSKPKNKGLYVYGIKSNGKYGRLNAAERGEMYYKQGKFLGIHGQEPTERDIEDFRAFLKEEIKVHYVPRIQDLENTQTLSRSMAYHDLQESGGEPQTDYVDYYDLVNEYARLETFLNDVTSLPKGVDDWYDSVSDLYGEETENLDDYENSEESVDFVDLDETTERAQALDVWTIMRRMKELYPEIAQSDELASETFRQIEALIDEENYSVEEITFMIINRYEKIKSEAQTRYETMREFDE